MVPVILLEKLLQELLVNFYRNFRGTTGGIPREHLDKFLMNFWINFQETSGEIPRDLFVVRVGIFPRNSLVNFRENSEKIPAKFYTELGIISG